MHRFENIKKPKWAAHQKDSWIFNPKFLIQNFNIQEQNLSKLYGQCTNSRSSKYLIELFDSPHEFTNSRIHNFSDFLLLQSEQVWFLEIRNNKQTYKISRKFRESSEFGIHETI